MNLKEEIEITLKCNKSYWDLYSLVAKHRLISKPRLSWNALSVLIYSMTDVYVTGETLRKWFTKDGKFISREEFNN
jgi:hypothetical protein